VMIDNVPSTKITPAAPIRAVRPPALFEQTDNTAAQKLARSEKQIKLSISSIWQEVAANIDVRAATPLEIQDASQILYEGKAITFEDHVNLSFQPELNADNPVPGLTGPNDEKDFIEIWQQKQTTATRFGANREELESIQRVQSILNYIDSLS